MSTSFNDRARPPKPRTVPLRRLLRSMGRDPLSEFEKIGRQSAGEVTRINLGPFRPYLVTRPEHVQRIMRDNVAGYLREGMMWRPLGRLVGQPSDADPAWAIKRGVYWSLLTGPSVAAYTDRMAEAISEAVDELATRVGVGGEIDVTEEITRIVYRAISRVFINDRIPQSAVDEIGEAISIATATSFRSRMLLPWVPHWIPLPGDRAFHRAVRKLDELAFPIVRAARRHASDGDDIVSVLIRARGENGERLTDKQVRDGIIELFVSATDTTIPALTFLWGVLDSHPDVAARLYAEIDSVIGTDQPGAAHLPKLVYTKMVIQELLRLYSIAWITPRTAAADDVIGGVPIKRGSTVLVSAYLTHRLPDVWPDPLVFDPERFAPGRSRPHFSFIAFGTGPNQCAGRVLFTVEAELIVATLVSRFRPMLQTATPIRAQVSMTLKPRASVRMRLLPKDRASQLSERP